MTVKTQFLTQVFFFFSLTILLFFLGERCGKDGKGYEGVSIPGFQENMEYMESSEIYIKNSEHEAIGNRKFAARNDRF